MQLKNLKLSASFLLYSTGILSLVIGLCGYLLVARMKSEIERSDAKELQLMRETLQTKGKLLSSFLARISFQPVVTEDAYTLNLFADELFADPEVAWFSVRAMSGESIYEKRSAAARDTASLERFERLVTFGDAPPAARLTLGLSRASIDGRALGMRADLEGRVREVILFCVAFALGLNALIAISGLAALRAVVLQPLRVVSEQLRDIAEGAGDLTKRIRLDSGNEMGVMARLFDGFLDRLQGVVRKVAEQTDVLTRASRSLADSSTRVADDTARVAEDAEKVSSSAEEAAGRMHAVSGEVERIFLSVSNISGSLAQINGSLNEVSRSCQKESEISGLANRKAQETKSLVRRLDKAALDIGQVLGVIKAIADRTNLLALNASIEAASAGEAGRGFAVVASEVKQLARQTGDATEEIRRTVGQIRAHTADSVAAIEEIAGIIEQVSTIAASIAGAVEEQSATVNEVANNLSAVDRSSQAMSENLRGTSGWISEVSANFSSVVHHSRDTSEGVRKAMESIRQLDALARQLRGIVSSFKA